LQNTDFSGGFSGQRAWEEVDGGRIEHNPAGFSAGTSKAKWASHENNIATNSGR
jgi:hypothetical protein